MVSDFQYKETRISAEEIYENTKDILVPNSTIFIATDEKGSSFFDPLRKHYKLLFLNDFKELIEDVNSNYMGMLDQRIASRGRTFVGAYLSTFTGKENEFVVFTDGPPFLYHIMTDYYFVGLNQATSIE